MRLIIVRHGQTDGNSKFLFHGHTDLDLNSEGRKQARKLAKSLRTQKIKAIYSSDLRRAYSTASIIGKEIGRKVVRVPELREINFGDWEKFTLEEIRKQHKKLYKRWKNHYSIFKMPNGESVREFRKRVEGFAEKLFVKYQNKKDTVLVVAHGGPNRILICKYAELPISCFFKLKQDNAAVNMIEFFDGIGYITLLNGKC